MAPTISDDEIEEIGRRHPYLILTREQELLGWKGVLYFNRSYEGVVIEDSFEVAIAVPATYPTTLPFVWETGGRLREIAEKWRDKVLGLADLHVYPSNGSVCLGAPLELQERCPLGAPFFQFIDDLVVPYFYGLSHFEKHGRWPWGERSHGILGLLESYGERRIECPREDVVLQVHQLRKCNNSREVRKYLRRHKDQRLCLCGKNRLFAECHTLAWNGLLKLQRDAKSHNLNVDHC